MLSCGGLSKCKRERETRQLVRIRKVVRDTVHKRGRERHREHEFSENRRQNRLIKRLARLLMSVGTEQRGAEHTHTGYSPVAAVVPREAAAALRHRVARSGERKRKKTATFAAGRKRCCRVPLVSKRCCRCCCCFLPNASYLTTFLGTLGGVGCSCFDTTPPPPPPLFKLLPALDDEVRLPRMGSSLGA